MEINTLFPFILEWIIPVGFIILIAILVFRRGKEKSKKVLDNVTQVPGFKASFFSRVVALWFDVWIFSFLQEAVIKSFLPEDDMEVIILTLTGMLFLLYKIVLEKKQGQTAGKWLLGITVKPEMEPIQWSQVFLRYVNFIAVFGIFAFYKSGMFSALENNDPPFNSLSVLLLFVVLPLFLMS